MWQVILTVLQNWRLFKELYVLIDTSMEHGKVKDEMKLVREAYEKGDAKAAAHSISDILSRVR